MSDFSLILVLQIKTSKIINDMAKVSIKSEKITAFGGIFFVLDIFDRILSSVIDSHLGLRSKLIGYQYSEIIRAIFSVFCCGGDCMEDLNLYLKDVLAERPHTAEARDCFCQFRNEGPRKTCNKKLETQPHAKCGSRSVLLPITALLENFLGFHSASFEHNATSARAGPSHSDGKGTNKRRKCQINPHLFCI